MRRNEEDFSICPRPQRTLHLNRPSGAGREGKMLGRGGCSGVASFEKIMRFKQRERERESPCLMQKWTKEKLSSVLNASEENERMNRIYFSIFSLSPFFLLLCSSESSKNKNNKGWCRMEIKTLVCVMRCVSKSPVQSRVAKRDWDWNRGEGREKRKFLDSNLSAEICKWGGIMRLKGAYHQRDSSKPFPLPQM